MIPKEQIHAARMEAIISPDTLEVVKRAGEMHGRSVGEFVVLAAQEAVHGANVIHLSIADQQRFVDLLVNPPPMSPALDRARKAHSRLIREEVEPSF